MLFALKLYDRLRLNDSVQPADLIFVMAGRMERKRYGIDLYRAGIAPRLVLSIGRFEVSKMSALGLEGIDELKALRDRTQPRNRHFFFEMNAEGVGIESVRLPVWNTYGEAVGLRTFLERDAVRRVIVISTDVHLRRVAMAFAKVFRHFPVEFHYCAVPRPAGRPDRVYVLQEAIKLAGYRLILSLPEPVVGRIMGTGKRRFQK